VHREARYALFDSLEAARGSGWLTIGAIFSTCLSSLSSPLIDKGSYDRRETSQRNDSAKERPPLKRGIGTRDEGGEDNKKSEGQSEKGLQLVELHYERLDMLAMPRLPLGHLDDTIRGTRHNVFVPLENSRRR
jgi:hypothetical protein